MFSMYSLMNTLIFAVGRLCFLEKIQININKQKRFVSCFMCAGNRARPSVGARAFHHCASPLLTLSVGVQLSYRFHLQGRDVSCHWVSLYPRGPTSIWCSSFRYISVWESCQGHRAFCVYFWNFYHLTYLYIAITYLYTYS